MVSDVSAKAEGPLWKGKTKKKTKTDKWLSFRKKWLKDHPPQGEHYVCHICQKPITESVTLDHKIPRSRAPHLVFDPNNIAPAHFLCNNLKGSFVLAKD